MKIIKLFIPLFLAMTGLAFGAIESVTYNTTNMAVNTPTNFDAFCKTNNLVRVADLGGNVFLSSNNHFTASLNTFDGGLIVVGELMMNDFVDMHDFRIENVFDPPSVGTDVSTKNYTDSVTNKCFTNLVVRETSGTSSGAITGQTAYVNVRANSDCSRVIQSDTNAWVSVGNGTATLYVAGVNTNYAVTSASTLTHISSGSALSSGVITNTYINGGGYTQCDFVATGGAGLQFHFDKSTGTGWEVYWGTDGTHAQTHGTYPQLPVTFTGDGVNYSGSVTFNWTYTTNNLATNIIATTAITNSLATTSYVATACSATLVSATNLANIASTNLIVPATNRIALLESQTNTYAKTTNGVQMVTVGGTNCVGSLTFAGNGLTISPSSGNSNLTFGTVEYVPLSIYPAAAPFELSWIGPHDETYYIESISAQSDAGTFEINVVSSTSNTLWRSSLTTNTSATITVGTVGIYSKAFSATTISPGTKVGIQVNNNYGCNEGWVVLKIHH